jgi:hypothetical protein
MGTCFGHGLGHVCDPANEATGQNRTAKPKLNEANACCRSKLRYHPKQTIFFSAFGRQIDIELKFICLIWIKGRELGAMRLNGAASGCWG